MTINHKISLHSFIEVEWNYQKATNLNTINSLPLSTNKISIRNSSTNSPTINILNMPLQHIDLLLEKFNIGKYTNGALTLEIEEQVCKSEDPIKGIIYGTKIEKYYSIKNSSFGIIKSVLSGIASTLDELDGWNPLHAACIEVEGRGCLIAGGSHAGKSTTIFEIASLCIKNRLSFSILTDDWVSVRLHNNSIKVKCFDSSISIDRQKITTYGSLFKIPYSTYIDIQTTGRKHSTPANNFFIESRHFNEMNFNTCKLFALCPDNSISDVFTMSSIDFAESAIACSYHYPYHKNTDIKTHINRWENICKHSNPTLIPTRSKKFPPNKVAEFIINNLLKI